METEDLRELLEKTAEDKQERPTDNIPSVDNPDADINEEDLGQYLVGLLKSYISDKEQMGWDEKRQYDLRAYHGLKEEWMSNFPWPNSSNYPVPITPVLLDTGWAAINDLIWRDKNKLVSVSGIGEEDADNAEDLQSVMNWVFTNGIQGAKREVFANTFQMLKHGTSHLKVVRQAREDGKFQLDLNTVPVEWIYMAIDAKSPEIGDSECNIQIVPLLSNDLRDRIRWGVYKNLDKIGKGWNVGNANSPEKLAQLKQQITGLDVTRRVTRDTWFIGEAEITYYPKYSLRARELIVWFAPSTGAILRVIDNTDKIRSLADWYVYPNPGMAYHRSLPEIVRHVQEKANYTDKQVTDAGDKAISPAGFYDSTSGFQPNMSLRVPTGMVPMKNVNSIVWEQVNIAPIMERKDEIRNLWLDAERISGFSDLWQGVNSRQTNTLGQDVLRSKKADIRFKTVQEYVDDAWKRTNNKIYEYVNRYMPRDVKVKILGSNEFVSIEKLFPAPDPANGLTQGLGLSGNYDFSIANKSVDDQEREDQNTSMLAGMLLSDSRAMQDLGNWYRTWKMKAEAIGFKNFGKIISKPKEADILTPDEVVECIMSGEKDIQPSVYADPSTYEERIRMYMRTGNFKEAPLEIKFEFEKFLKIVIAIRIGKEQAFQKFQQQQAMMMAQQALTQHLQSMPQPTPTGANGNGNGSSATPQ